MGDNNLMAEQEYAYSDYWEKCWDSEDESELYILDIMPGIHWFRGT